MKSPKTVAREIAAMRRRRSIRKRLAKVRAELGPDATEDQVLAECLTRDLAAILDVPRAMLEIGVCRDNSCGDPSCHGDLKPDELTAAVDFVETIDFNRVAVSPPAELDDDAEFGSDDDLPGAWTKSDFEGGDPDERSYAERESAPTGKFPPPMFTVRGFLFRYKRGSIFPAHALDAEIAAMPPELRTEKRTWEEWLDEFEPMGLERKPDPGPMGTYQPRNRGY
jgi:hypothetical protein